MIQALNSPLLSACAWMMKLHEVCLDPTRSIDSQMCFHSQTNKHHCTSCLIHPFDTLGLIPTSQASMWSLAVNNNTHHPILSETPVNLYLQQVQVTGHVCLGNTL